MIKKGVSYFGNRYARHYAEDLKELLRVPFEYVIHTFSENDFAYNRGSVRKMVEMTRKAGLEVYVDPWGVGRVFGGEAESDFVARYPSECQVSTSGRRVAAACPNRPGFRDFMLTWIDAAVDLEPDIFFWDEPHFFLNSAAALADPQGYQDWCCRCDVCRERYEFEEGHPLEDSLTVSAAAFRERCLIEFIGLLTRETRSRGFRNNLCLLPLPDVKFSRILGIEDWDKAAAVPSVDILSTDPYWSIFNLDPVSYVSSFAGKTIDLARRHGKESEVWIQGFKISKGMENEVRDAIRAAVSFNPSRIAVWSFRGTECMSSLSCGDPEAVWGTISDEFRKF